MHTISYLDGVIEAQREEMERDEKVFLMGEDVSWNMQGTTRGLADAFGLDRVRDTPIAEAGFVGAGAGAAMVGMRPIVEIEIAPFIYPAMDQIVSIIAKSTYLYGGQASIPLTIRAPLLYGAGNAAQHSDRPWATLMTIPGLKIIAPSTPYDVKGMLKTAIRENDPVVCFEDANCWGSSSEVPDDGDFTLPLGKAELKREGSDLTVVALAGAVRQAVQAADELAQEGISAEVLDLRSIVPMDREAILTSVAKTGRLVVADPAHEMGSVASEIAAVVAQEGFWDLQAPIVRVTTPHTHIPFSAGLERPLYPSAQRLVAAAHTVIS